MSSKEIPPPPFYRKIMMFVILEEQGSLHLRQLHICLGNILSPGPPVISALWSFPHSQYYVFTLSVGSLHSFAREQG